MAPCSPASRISARFLSSLSHSAFPNTFAASPARSRIPFMSPVSTRLALAMETACCVASSAHSLATLKPYFPMALRNFLTALSAPFFAAVFAAPPVRAAITSLPPMVRMSIPVSAISIADETTASSLAAALATSSGTPRSSRVLNAAPRMVW